MDKKIYNQLKGLLYKGLYEDAEEYISGIDFGEVKDMLFIYAYEESQLSSYSFERYMYDKTVMK